jgi:hypothetical protein
VSHVVLNISSVPTKGGQKREGQTRNWFNLYVDNLLLKDAVHKCVFDKPILNTKVSVSDILLTVQRIQRRVSRATSWRGVPPVKLTEGGINSDYTESPIETKQ